MAYSNDCLEVIFSSDDNYARHLGAALYSLLAHNREFGHINVYVIDNEIRPENRAKLEETAAAFPNASLIFIDFAPWRDNLRLNLAWPISLSSYARLFVGSKASRTDHIGETFRRRLLDRRGYAGMVGEVDDALDALRPGLVKTLGHIDFRNHLKIRARRQCAKLLSHAPCGAHDCNFHNLSLLSFMTEVL